MIKTFFKVGFFLLLLAGLAAAWLHFSESDAIKAGRFASQAREWLAQGRTEEAMVTWRRAVALDPKQAAFRVELARLYMDTGKIDAAVRELELAVELEPGNADARKLVAEAERRRGNAEGAKRHARALARTRPFDGYLMLARAAATDGRIHDADRWYRRAIDEVKRTGEGTTSTDAVTAAEAALEWARVLERFGPSRSEAARLARETAAKAGEAAATPAGWFTAALALEESGKLEDAAKLLDRALQADGKFEPAILARARVALASGDAVKAECHLFELGRRGGDAAVRAARAALAGGKPELALKLVAKVQGDEAFSTFSEANIALGRDEDALEAARQAGQTLHSGVPLAVCGQAFRKAGKDSLAERAFLDAVMTEPERVDFIAALAALRAKMAGKSGEYGDFQKAESDLSNLITVSPSEPAYRWALGDLYERFGRPEAALASYLDASTSPQFFENAVEKAAVLAGGKAFESLAAKCVEDEDRARLVRRVRSALLRRTRQWDAALAEAGEPTDSTAALERADILASAGRGDEAVEVLRQAAARRDAGTALRTRLAGLFLESGRVAEARESLKGIEARDRDADVYLLLSRVVEADGGEALAIDREAWLRFGGDARIAYRYARRLYLAGQADEALQALSSAPTHVLTNGLEGEIRVALGQVDEAAGCYVELLRDNPDSIVACTKLATLARKDGRAWADDAPQGTEAWVTATVRGVRAQLAGDDAAAAAAYELAIAEGAGTVVYNNLAWIRAEQGRFDDAETLAETARQRAPRSPTVADTLGWVAYRKGDYARARLFLEEAAAEGIDNPTHCYHLACVYAATGRDRAEIRSLYERANAARADFEEKEAFTALVEGRTP